MSECIQYRKFVVPCLMTLTMPTASESQANPGIDECHTKIRQQLLSLADLSHRLDTVGIDSATQRMANEIGIFFASTSRQHHIDEETNVFPAWLASTNDALVTGARTLKQDHGWIEENLIELGPQLSAIASGNNWFAISEFQHGVIVFIELYRKHMELEELLMAHQQSKC